MSDSSKPVTSIAPIAPPVSAMTMPSEGTVERARFTQAAADMVAVLSAAELNPRAIVLWHGVERCAGDLARAWRKLALDAERKRLATK